MIQSQFVTDILDLMFDDDKDGLRLRNQVSHLTEQEYIYTGNGLFVSFSHSDTIFDFKLESNTSLIDGVEVNSSILQEGADAAVFILDGIIVYLEIWSKSGYYPPSELADYILIQVWEDSPKRQIVRQ